MGLHRGDRVHVDDAGPPGDRPLRPAGPRRTEGLVRAAEQEEPAAHEQQHQGEVQPVQVQQQRHPMRAERLPRVHGAPLQSDGHGRRVQARGEAQQQLSAADAPRRVRQSHPRVPNVRHGAGTSVVINCPVS